MEEPTPFQLWERQALDRQELNPEAAFLAGVEWAAKYVDDTHTGACFEILAGELRSEARGEGEDR